MEYSLDTINNENLDSLGGPVDKNTPASARDMGLTPGVKGFHALQGYCGHVLQLSEVGALHQEEPPPATTRESPRKAAKTWQRQK